MRSSSSRHVLAIRTPSSHVWARSEDLPFRPYLNVLEFAELLQSSAPQYVVQRNSKGKKRSASRAAEEVRSVKRLNTATSSSSSSDSKQKLDPPTLNLPPHVYPGHLSLKGWDVENRKLLHTADVVPVFHHLLEIQYTRGEVPEDARNGWKLEEEKLNGVIAELRSSLSSPMTIDLGDFQLAVYKDRLVLVTSSRQGSPLWLLLLPRYTQDFDAQWNNYTSPVTDDFFMAAFILHSDDRARVTANVKVVVNPSTSLRDSNSLPFELQVEIKLSFVVPNILNPVPRNRKDHWSIEDAQRRVLDYLYPTDRPTPDSFHGSIDIPFFYSIMRPAPALPHSISDAALQPKDLVSTLLPFQRRSVAWLLEREGKTVTGKGDIISKPKMDNFSLWEMVQDGNYTWYRNRLNGNLCSEEPPEIHCQGGILAEEPGLGKTLEIISLILLNPAAPIRTPKVKRWDPEACLYVKCIKTTLIVTPPALASQWVDELAAHAPSLKVMVYDGWKKVPVRITGCVAEADRIKSLKRTTQPKKRGRGNTTKRGKKTTDSEERRDVMNIDEPEEDFVDWCSYVQTFDVVITTYQVLRNDLNVARAPPVRPRREDTVYSNTERPRSPLVMCEWYRVIMDEVQMAGGGRTEDMVSLIPRLSSFAVSGTPAKAQIADLVHVLKFLRIDTIFDFPRLWTRMISCGFGAAHFAALFQSCAIRTLKSQVNEELTIPQQTRFLVGITMGPVERHVYDQALEAVLLELGLDARGIATSQGWEVDSTVLRSAIRRLRGICTHPQVGQLQRTYDRLTKPGVVKTINDVLKNMEEQNWRSTMDDVKSRVQSLISYAQLQRQDEKDLGRYRHALETLLQAEKEANILINDVKASLKEVTVESSRWKAETESDGDEDPATNGKGKERFTSEATESRTEDDLLQDGAADELRKRRSALQNRLRECLLTLHRAKFLQGDMHHVLGDAASEDAAYGAAEEIRRTLLKSTEADAERAMSQLMDEVAKKQLKRKSFLLHTPYLNEAPALARTTGLQPTPAELSAKPVLQKVTLYNRACDYLSLITEANDIIQEVLNKQGDLLWDWRTHIVNLITQSLSSRENEADGEEYQRTLDNQGEAEAYLQCYAAILADRRQAIINERTLLAAHDAREKRLRQTKAAMKAAQDDTVSRLEDGENVDLQPEHEVLHKQLSEKRKALLQLLEGRAIKSIIVELNAMSTRTHKDTDPDRIILKEAIAALRKLITAETGLLDKLESDLGMMRKVFNQRILYFRQLQEISDSVAEVTWEGTLADALENSREEQRELEGKINTSRARQRYLVNLAKGNADGNDDEDEECCILCRCEFTRGFVTQCAHVFCEGCMKAWMLRKEGKTCPVCRVMIDPDTVQRFTIDQSAPQPSTSKPANVEPIPKSRRMIAYNTIDHRLLGKIQSVDSFGDFGTKIQTLVRHILYLREADPGAKSIVFSAWADSLHIMQQALQENGITSLRIDQNSKKKSAAKKFKDDPDILVLLLHGERENAGLNITCASRVFLMESVVHHGFEIQAIARIDRMGQSRRTEVYCYYAEDTVERNILDLAARKGMSLYTKDNSAGTLNITSLVNDTEKKKDIDHPMKKKVQKGDFIYKTDDMLAILFPHMYEDIEYLIPEDALSLHTGNRVSRGGIEVDAVAGPSRSRS